MTAIATAGITARRKYIVRGVSSSKVFLDVVVTAPKRAVKFFGVQKL